jgi:hypothetical protein
VGAALDAAIDEILETLNDEQRAEPRFYPDNYPAWAEFFWRRYERELAVYDGPPPPPARNKPPAAAAGGARRPPPREAVLAHIERGNSPVVVTQHTTACVVCKSLT